MAHRDRNRCSGSAGSCHRHTGVADRERHDEHAPSCPNGPQEMRHGETGQCQTAETFAERRQDGPAGKGQADGHARHAQENRTEVRPLILTNGSWRNWTLAWLRRIAGPRFSGLVHPHESTSSRVDLCRTAGLLRIATAEGIKGRDLGRSQRQGHIEFHGNPMRSALAVFDPANAAGPRHIDR